MTKKVLIAEDRADSRKLLVDILDMFAAQNLNVLTAVNGADAYQMILDEQPDLIFMDVMMPQMSGLEVCEKVKSDPDLAGSYIIMVSAKYEQTDRDKATAVGADEYITKPYDVTVIVERVRKILNLPL